MLAEYRLKQSELELERQKLKRLRLKPAETIDGMHVELHANIELPEDLEQTLENGATGVGLFRSEFLFLNRDGAAVRGRAVRGLPRAWPRAWRASR